MNLLTLFAIAALCFLYLLVPNRVIAKELGYRILVFYVNTETENLYFYDYKVYGTKKIFNAKFIDYVIKEKEILKDKNELTVVKINGENGVSVCGDFVLVRDVTVPELNVEIYIAKNIDFKNYSLPCKTVAVFAFNTLNLLIEIVYCVIFAAFFGKLFVYIARQNKKKFIPPATKKQADFILIV